MDYREAQRYIAAAEARQAKTDPVALARVAGFTPDPWQESVLRSRASRVLLNCTRQGGKSTVTGVAAGDESINRPNSLTLLLAPTLRQSSELFRKVMGTYRAVSRRIEVPSLVEATKLSVEFSNGSRIVCLPESEDTIRGFSAPSLVVVDEAAFCSDALYLAVRPMLAVSNGRLFLISSPNGRRGFFFDAWHDEKTPWQRHSATAYDCPRISAEFLEQERIALGPLRYAQEYECKFIAGATGQVYAYSTDNLAMQIPPLQYYLLAIDYGFNDDCAFSVLGWRDNDPTVYVVSAKKYPGMIPSAAAEHTRALDSQYRFVRMVGDTGGLGKGYAEEARTRFGLPIEQADKNNKRGYIDLFNDALRTQRLAIFGPSCGELVREWEGLVWDETRQREIQGAPNHCADATLYGWRATTAFLNVAAEERPKPGTDAHTREVERRMIAQVEAEMEDDERDEWWKA